MRKSRLPGKKTSSAIAKRPGLTADALRQRQFEAFLVGIGKWPIRRRNKSFKGSHEFRWNKASYNLGFDFMVSFPKEHFENYSSRVSLAVGHESPVGLQLLLGRAKLLAEVALNFAKVEGYGRSLLFDGIQGFPGRKARLGDFAQKAGSQWANFLIEKALAHAGKCGLESAGIIDPRSLYWFQKPSGCRTESGVGEMQTRILGMYKSVAKRLGFDTAHPVKAGRGVYWMKML